MRKFHLVDFAAHGQKGFRNHIVSIAEVPALVESFGRLGCYATYFLYSDEVLTYLSMRAGGAGPTIAGYEGKVWATHFPLDIDHEDLSVSLQAARQFAKLFLASWKVDAKGLQVYFSGQKGFHLMLDTRLFGHVVPSKSLPLAFASLRRHLAQELPGALRETVDLSIKDRVRLLRLPNTAHEKTGLYKILLSAEELAALSAGEIRKRARQSRPLATTDETGFLSDFDVKENAAAAGFFARIQRQVRRLTRKPFEYKFRRPADLSRMTFPCAGAQRIWESHVDVGFRNNCAIRLASELRLLGLLEEETRQKLAEWNEKNDVGLPDHELQAVLRSAYQHPFPYRYGCRDEILRHFCPLPTYEDCQAHVKKEALS